ncbi:hypothetical protein SAMN04487909_108204 [Aneurinibacillus migulanus]|uniref:Uncharacterized protein n=1 Tax=Aneurinibacillus migulanus TaxID=47500 RepID=A0A1G8P1W5_ANEMI|nr:hypothetical protein SAMN04487909_108204 [Aneurinibacillus migulanus]
MLEHSHDRGFPLLMAVGVSYTKVMKTNCKRCMIASGTKTEGR